MNNKSAKSKNSRRLTFSSLWDRQDVENYLKCVDAEFSIQDFDEFTSAIVVVAYLDKQKKFPDKRGVLHRQIREYITSRDAEVLAKDIGAANYCSLEAFTLYLSQYKVDRYMDVDAAKRIVSALPLPQVLESKHLVDNYSDVIVQKFLSSPENIELLINEFAKWHSKKSFAHSLPISPKKFKELILSYISSEHANPNYLQLLVEPPKRLESLCNIDAQIRLTAKKKKEELEKKIFSEGRLLKTEILVYSNQELYAKARTKQTRNYRIIDFVDAPYLEGHNDFPDIAEYLQFNMGLFEPNFLSSLPNYPNVGNDLLTQHMGVHAEDEYQCGPAFELGQQAILMKLRLFIHVIRGCGKSIEELLKWFLSRYCKEVYNVDLIVPNLPLEGDSTQNKTSLLCIAQEKLRKQYQLLAENGVVDAELLNYIGTPKFQNQKSLLDKKYVYFGNSEAAQKMKRAACAMHSSQTTLAYLSPELHAHTLAGLLNKFSISKMDFNRDKDQAAIEELIEIGVISESDEGTLIPGDYDLGWVLYMLYHYNEISYHHTLSSQRKELDDLITQGVLDVENKFFSRHEAAYLSYLLDDTRFSNSLGVRNKYAHGTPEYKGGNADDRYLADYLIVLVVVVILIMRINEELSLKYCFGVK